MLNGVSRLPAERVPLLAALGRVLAEPIQAADDLPPFANSAMDGYALRSGDVAAEFAAGPVSLQVVADLAAGEQSEVVIGPGQAARIMTGAPLPQGADTIVPVEDTSEAWRGRDRAAPERIEIRRFPERGDFVRPAGEDIRRGSTVLAAGHLIRPQEIGLLAALGVSEAPVIKRPRVGVLATGDELLPIDRPLAPGKIRNSNAYAQAAQVLALGATPVDLGVARDDETSLRDRLRAGLELEVDLFVSSAGVSVGAHDVVKSVLEQDGEIIFWRVRMRPGKPLTFGRYGGRAYLGLPGNPVSALVAFERFARPAILKLAGHTDLARPTVEAVVDAGLHSDGRESYVRAVVRRDGEGYAATPTGAQGSHMLTSLVAANALLVIPAGVESVSAGERLAAVMLDWPETVF